jgi:hypothetical protein
MPRHVPARALSMACASASTLFSCLSDLHDAQVRFFAASENMTLVDILRKHVRKVKDVPRIMLRLRQVHIERERRTCVHEYLLVSNSMFRFDAV